MKRVLLRDRGTFRARDVITTLVEQPSGNGAGVTYADMRKRDRILDTLEASKGEPYFDIEDADYETLKTLMENFQFGTAKRELRQILDDIAHARSPEDTPQLKLVEEGGAA